MHKARRDQINRLAEVVLSSCELTPPVDVEQAVIRLGGELVYDSDIDFEARIEKAGVGFKITLSPNASHARTRFSIAHELGHLFLHMGYLLDEEKWESVGDYTDSVYYRFGYNTEEHEANEFAAAFLMPRIEFERVANQHRVGNMFDVESIAKHFDVSKDAAATRGRWLGLFSW